VGGVCEVQRRRHWTIAATVNLWGTSLTAKRDEMVAARAGESPSPATVRALRGRTTRELGQQITTLIE
jgi:hypothetical protein